MGQMGLKRDQNGTKKGLKRDQKETKMGPKRYQNGYN